MSSGKQQYVDPEDMFADTRMSFGDHLEELRSHLWRAIYGFGVALVFGFFVAPPLLQIISAPVEQELKGFYDRRVQKVLHRLKQDPAALATNAPTEFFPMSFDRRQIQMLLEGKPTEDINNYAKPVLKIEEQANKEKSWWEKIFGSAEEEVGNQPHQDIEPKDIIILWMRYQQPQYTVALTQKAEQEVGRRPLLSTLSVQEGIVVYFKVALVAGLVIGSPWIFWQIWMFIAAGLYPHEKKLVHVYLPLSLGLFIGGVLLCQFFVMPQAVKALLWFNEWLGFEPDLRLNEWLGFAIMMPVVFGLSFQTPLFMMFAERIGLVSIETFRTSRRLAWFALAFFAAFITPSVDPISMLLMWVPLCLLWEFGIYLCTLAPKPPDFDSEVPEDEEMIEV